MELSAALREDAIAAGLCEEHIAAWDKESVYDLVEYYKANPDWCLERKYPTYPFLCEHFDKAAVQAQGVCIGQQDMEMRLEAPEGLPVYVLNKCSGTIIVEGWMVARLYVALDSKLKIIVKDNAALILDYYDDAEIEVHHESKGRVRIYQYGNRVPKMHGNAIRLTKKYGGHRQTL